MAVKRPSGSENIPNREELFSMAVEQAKSGNKKGARFMFAQILEQDKRNVRVMMWLAKLAATSEDREMWLRRVLEVKPDYAPAQEALNKLTHNAAARRNQQLFRLAVGGYVGLVIIVSLVVMVSAALAPAV